MTDWFMPPVNHLHAPGEKDGFARSNTKKLLTRFAIVVINGNWPVISLNASATVRLARVGESC